MIFLPQDSAWDGRGDTAHSSFAHAVFSFRKRTGRESADARRFDTFEHVYIGLFDPQGRVGFFDVLDSPPRNQVPQRLLTLEALLALLGESARERHLSGGDERFASDDSAWVPPASPVESAIEAALARGRAQPALHGDLE